MKFFDLEVSGLLAGGSTKRGGRAQYFAKVVNGACTSGWFTTPNPETTPCSHNGSYYFVHDIDCANHAPGDQGTIIYK